MLGAKWPPNGSSADATLRFLERLEAILRPKSLWDDENYDFQSILGPVLGYVGRFMEAFFGSTNLPSNPPTNRHQIEIRRHFWGLERRLEINLAYLLACLLT